MKNLNKMSLLKVLIGVLLPCFACAQLPIYYSEYDFEMKRKSYSIGDTLRFDNQDNKRCYSIVILDEMGKSYFEELDSMGQVMSCGSYGSSLDTLARYVKHFNVLDYSEKIVVFKYYQPLREGEWLIYDEKRNKIKHYYNKGIKAK